MFEVGKYYVVKMWENRENGGVISEYSPVLVIEVTPPLVKCKGSMLAKGNEFILNTASLAFVSAEVIA